jgi:uncharacterized protein YceH (UPF0502 family)
MLTHGLLPEEKLEKVRRELGLAMAAAAQAAPAAECHREEDDGGEPLPARQSLAPASADGHLESRIVDLEREVAALHARLKALEDALG